MLRFSYVSFSHFTSKDFKNKTWNVLSQEKRGKVDRVPTKGCYWAAGRLGVVRCGLSIFICFLWPYESLTSGLLQSIFLYMRKSWNSDMIQIG